MELLIGLSIISILIPVLIGYLPFYILTGVLLFDYNKRAYGKGRALAWIPFIRLYLFGKYAFNETIGVLLFFSFLFFLIFFQNEILVSLTSIFILVSIIITIINYFKLRKGEIPISLKNERELQEKEEKERVNNQNDQTKITNEKYVNEIKSTELYDASLSHIQTVEYNKTPEQQETNIQVEKINCPNCGTLINKDIALCPFCGKQTK